MFGLSKVMYSGVSLDVCNVILEFAGHAMTLGPVIRSPIKLILSVNFNCYLFTVEGGFATKLWPSKVINYKFVFLKP